MGEGGQSLEIGIVRAPGRKRTGRAAVGVDIYMWSVGSRVEDGRLNSRSWHTGALVCDLGSSGGGDGSGEGGGLNVIEQPSMRCVRGRCEEEIA